jgi:hypothetical protein
MSFNMNTTKSTHKLASAEAYFLAMQKASMNTPKYKVCLSRTHKSDPKTGKFLCCNASVCIFN